MQCKYYILLDSLCLLRKFLLKIRLSMYFSAWTQDKTEKSQAFGSIALLEVSSTGKSRRKKTEKRVGISWHLL